MLLYFTTTGIPGLYPFRRRFRPHPLVSRRVVIRVQDKKWFFPEFCAHMGGVYRSEVIARKYGSMAFMSNGDSTSTVIGLPSTER